jgi:transcriptional regulator with XRE-family HTH domain
MARMQQTTLAAVREKRRLTLEELAEKSGVHKSTISRLERGETKPEHATVTALEAALGLRRGTLVFGEVAASK